MKNKKSSRRVARACEVRDFERWLREKKELYERLLLSAIDEWDAFATERCLERSLERIAEMETVLKLVERYQKEMIEDFNRNYRETCRRVNADAEKFI